MPAAIITGVAAVFGGGAIATAVATFAVNFAISAVIGAVFGPDEPEQSNTTQKDSGVDTRVSPDPRNKLPIIYGESKVRGTVVMADMSSDNQRMAYIIALGEGNINSVSNVYWEDKTLSMDGDVTTGTRGVTGAVDSDGVSSSFLNGNLFIRVFPSGGLCTPMESFSSAWNNNSSNRAMPQTAYMYVEIKYNREEGITRLSDISLDVEGKKVRTLSGGVASGSTYSNNPAETLLDYLTDTTSGLGLSDSQIDLDSLQDLKDFCDQNVTYTTLSGASGTAKRFSCNGVVNTNEATSTNLKSLLSCCQSTLAFSLGKFGVVINKSKAVTRTLGDDDIIGGISVTDSGFEGLTNHLTLRYRSKNNNDKGDQVVIESPSSVKNFNEPLLERTIDLDFTNNNVEVERIGTVMLNQSRQSLTAKFVTTVKHLDLSSGDIIAINNDTTGWSAKEFRIMSIVEQKNDVMTLEITALEYASDMYTDININETDVAPNTNLLDVSLIQPVDTLTAVDLLENIPQIKVNWTVSDDTYVDHFDILYKKVGDTNFITIPVKGREYVISDIESGVSYDVCIRAVSVFGNFSTVVDETVAVLSRAPANPQAFTFAEEIYNTNKAAGVRSRVKLSWTHTPVSGVNFEAELFSVFQRVSGTSLWIPVDITNSTEVTIQDIDTGSYDFAVVATSYAGIDSPQTVLTTQTVAGLTASPQNVTGFSVNPNGAQALLSWDVATELDVLFGGSVQIRYNPNTDNSATWETSQLLVKSLSGTTTSKSVPLIVGSYFIKFIDSGNRESTTATLITNAFKPNGFNLVYSNTENPTFAGDKINFTVNAGSLDLDLNQLSGVYTFNAPLDLGRVQTVRLTPDYQVTAYTRGTLFCDVVDVCAVSTICQNAPNSSVVYEIRETDDDPNGSPVWSDWQVLIAGEHRARGLEFRVKGEVYSVNDAMDFSKIAVLVDTVDVTEVGTALSLTTGDETVTFSNAGFYSGIAGADVPIVGVNIIGGQDGDNVVITTRTATEFTFSVYNGGSRVARDIDWQAIGQ